MPALETINLHPITHQPSSLKSHVYDVICLGSGWAGRVLAARVVQGGLTALIVENELIGGDCPFWACVPSKAILRPSEVLEAAKTVGGARERVERGKGVDVEAMWQRRDMYTAGWDDTKVLVPMVEQSGVEVVRGMGTIVGTRKVKVEAWKGDAVELEARHAVAVCTGSEVVFPDVPGLKEAKPWTSREATSASVLPEHLVIMGGGVVGCEMATAYSSFGAKVTLISSTAEILPRLDAEAGRMVRESLTSRGVVFYLSTNVTAVKREPQGSVQVTLSNGKVVSAAELLVATGRRPRTGDVGLEALGLATDGTPIAVNESLCVTSVPGNWLYAVGDVNGRALMTHMSKYQGRIAGNAIVARAKGKSVEPDQSVAWDNFSATADHAAVPQVVFTDPIVASVGLTSAAAKAAGRSVREIAVPFTILGSILHADEYTGWAQWIVDPASNTLLGATFVGRDVVDLLHASTVAIAAGVTLGRLVHAVPSFPTMTEVYLTLIDAAGM